MNRLVFILVLIMVSFLGSAQEVLTLSDAVKITLENDYNIKVAENSSKVAENNTSIYANGYLPTISGRTGANYRNQNINRNNYDGSSTDVTGSQTLGYNASVGVNYTLFDGMYRAYNYEKSKELYNLSKLQVRQVVESTLLELFAAYYSVANLSESLHNLSQTLQISKARLVRVKYGAEYGKNTQLDVLNAEVDVNTDSINVLNSHQNLENAKRNLNVLMGRNVSYSFAIDTAVSYEQVQELSRLLEKAQLENIRLLKAQKNLELSGYDIKLFKTNFIPTIDLSGNYAFTNNNYNKKKPIEHETFMGPQAELSLVWNIFDGGRTKVGVKNAKIAEESSLVQQEQAQKQVERDVINAYTTYNNSLFVMQAEKKNLQTSERNFTRSEEQYKLGQLTSVEFRQAQLNLLYAENRYNQAKYQSKIYELSLFKLTGDLLNIKY